MGKERPRLSALLSDLRRSLNTPVVIGFGLCLGWLNVSFSGIGLFTAITDVQVLFFRSEQAYLLLIGTAAVTLLTCSVLHKQTRAVLMSRGLRVGLPVGMALSTLATVCAGLGAGLSTEVFIASGVVSGLCWGLLMMQWNTVLERLSVGHIFLTVACSYLLAMLISTLFPLLSESGTVVLAALMPPASAFLLWTGQKGVHSEFEAGRKSVQAGPDNEAATLRSVMLRLGVCLFVWSFTNKLIRTVYAYLDVEVVSGRYFNETQNVAALVITLIMGAMITWLLVYPREFRFEFVYRAVFLFSLAGILFIPLATAGHSPLLFYSLNSAAYHVFRILMWTMLTAICHHHPQRSVQLFGFIGGLWALGVTSGIVTGGLFSSALSASADTIDMLTMATVLLLGLNYTVVFTENTANSLTAIAPFPKKAPFKACCEATAQRYGLSAREQEVLYLVATGRDSAYIQKALCLSKSTIATHRTHIYQKLDIHSKQELLDVIEAAGATSDE